MKIFFEFIITSLIIVGCSSSSKDKKTTYDYPNTYKDTTILDDYFGNKIADPYRWLEDDNSEETKKWVISQNAVTNTYLNKIPFRNKLKEQLTNLWDYESIGTPSKYGNFYIFSKNDGKQNQAVYFIKNGKDGKASILVDPNQLSEDGTTSIGSLSVSKDNKHMAYTISKSGSDWKEIVIMDLHTKEYLTDHINWVKFSGISWYKNGFYYSGYTAPKEGKEFSNKNEFHTVFYHEIGTNQTEDKIVYRDNKNPLRNHRGYVTEDERFLIISGSEGTSGNMLLAKDLTKKTMNFTTLVSDFNNDSYVVDNLDEKLLIITNYQTPNKKVVYATLDQPAKENWQDFIPEKEYLLERIAFVGDKLFANYLKDVQSKIEIYDLNGSYIKDLKLPGIGICSRINGKKGNNTAYYTYTSFTTPSTAYELNTTNLNSQLYFRPEVNFNANNYETKQAFYKSKDGSKIPMFITYKKGVKLDGNNPCLLYGYGGFNISYKPSFDVAKSVFIQNGGIYAVANLRGGSEYGEEWHKAGMLNNKQNVFDDFIAAANYLKNNKYTSTKKLAIHGRSNGGLLVGAVMTQQPELAKVALPMVGVLDMLRYHKFTIGWAWAVEYGSSDKKEDFENLIQYSPLHNVLETKYPATMILTADHDDRVVPAHSFKYAATLQKKNQSNDPILIRIDSKSGHGSGKPKSKLIEEWADIWAFTFYNLGVDIQ